jgi:transcriptional regulator with XRE-family HTH domain
MFIKIIEEKMNRRNLSTRAAARQIGVAHTTLERVLQGKQADLDTLVLICDWLSVRVSTVLSLQQGGEDELANKIALLLAKHPELASWFEKAANAVEAGEIPVVVLRDILAYTIFTLNNAMEHPRR